MKSPPLPITFLHAYIKNWRATEEGILIYPKGNEFDKLTLRPHITFLMGEPLGWEFIATINIVPAEKMTEKAVELYKHLKTAECELKWHGLIRRKPRFKPVIGTRSDPELATILNVNESLSKALIMANINDLMAKLSPSQGKVSEKNVVESDAAHSEPREITWVIMALKSYTLPIERLNRAKCESDFINTFKALSEISKIVKNLSLDKLEKRDL